MKDTSKLVSDHPIVREKEDRYRWFHAALIGSYCLLNILLLAFYPAIPYYLAILFFFLIPALGIGILLYCLFGIVVDAFNKRWRLALSKVTPLILVTIFGLFVRAYTSDDARSDALDWLRLQVSKPLYLIEIAITEVNGETPSLKKWDWGQTNVFLGGGARYILVYDDNDQMLLPEKSRSDNWKRRAKEIDLKYVLRDQYSWDPPKPVIIKHIENHFYLLIQEY